MVLNNNIRFLIHKKCRINLTLQSKMQIDVGTYFFDLSVFFISPNLDWNLLDAFMLIFHVSQAKENEIKGGSGSALCNDDMWRTEEEAGSVMLGLQRSGVGSVLCFSSVSPTHVSIQTWRWLTALPHFCPQRSPATAGPVQISARCWTTGNLPSSPKWKTCWSMTTPPSYLNIAGRCSPPLTVTINEQNTSENKTKQKNTRRQRVLLARICAISRLT